MARELGAALPVNVRGNAVTHHIHVFYIQSISIQARILVEDDRSPSSSGVRVRGGDDARGRAGGGGARGPRRGMPEKIGGPRKYSAHERARHSLLHLNLKFTGLTQNLSQL
jgi:hypothetical protein